MLAALAGCAAATVGNGRPSAATLAAPACRFTPGDQQWLDRSLAAWRYMVKGAAAAGKLGDVEAVVFDDRCVLQSGTAMAGGREAWLSRTHDGQVRLPDSAVVPAEVASFAGPTSKGAFFVMAAPSVWRSGGVGGGAIGLENLMTAVMLHEASHVLQFGTYVAQVTDLIARHRLPQSFNDDSIQDQFEKEAEFAASMNREIDLLFAAAAAPDEASAARLARQARALMKARHSKWFSGDRAHLVTAEDLWLSMEGAGQWLGYQWLVDPRGAALPREAALTAFAKRGKWWSQRQGVALFLVLDRLSREDWKSRAFGDGRRTALEMLDAALAEAD